MAGDGRKHTRLPCLATARTLVAIVVTVLAVAVVVMLIVVVHRPVTVSLQIYPGYILADNWWQVSTTGTARGNTTELAPTPASVREHTKAATEVKLKFRLTIHNPSGRGEINCSINSMIVVDMPNSLFQGMVEIGRMFYPEKPRPFLVSQHASHTLQQRMIINDTDALDYIYRKYKEEKSFESMVQVNISCKAPPPATGTDMSNHYCWPVEVVLDKLYNVVVDTVTCKKIKEIVYPLVWQPAPASAPAPMGSAG